jgi:hypothetical protein
MLSGIRSPSAVRQPLLQLQSNAPGSGHDGQYVEDSPGFDDAADGQLDFCLQSPSAWDEEGSPSMTYNKELDIFDCYR